VKDASPLAVGKVTTTNFFNDEDEELRATDKDLNNASMISGQVDPEEWYGELKRIK
jgi:hypothetical protein